MIRDPERLVTDFHTNQRVPRRSLRDIALNCAGCGAVTKEYDHLYGWHICEDCDSDKIAEHVADHVTNPNRGT